MRLKKEQIEKLSLQILKHLKDKELIKIKADEAQILARIEKAFIQDFEAEDQLDQDVENLMAQFRPQIQAGQLNERDLFLKIKKELAKKKKVVLWN